MRILVKSTSGNESRIEARLVSMGHELTNRRPDVLVLLTCNCHGKGLDFDLRDALFSGDCFAETPVVLVCPILHSFWNISGSLRERCLDEELEAALQAAQKLKGRM